MDVRSGHSVVIDIDDYVEQTKEKWINYTLSPVNDSLVRLGIFEGEFHWHHHDLEDEMFLVLSGKLLLDVGNKARFVATIEDFLNLFLCFRHIDISRTAPIRRSRMSRWRSDC